MATYKNIEAYSAHLVLNLLTALTPSINQQTVTLFCFYFLHTYILLSSHQVLLSAFSFTAGLDFFLLFATSASSFKRTEGDRKQLLYLSYRQP